MIEYSKRALKAISFLFRPYNDIDIYVEDSTCHNMWELLINTILKNRVKVKKIFPLGGKTEVIKSCQKDQGKTVRPKLYIIDGDLEFVVGRKAPGLKYLYRLNACNVENLLFSEMALIEIGLECKPNLPRSSIRKLLAFEKLRNELVRKLRPLFIIYGASFLLDQDFDLKTVGYNIMNLTTQKGRMAEISKDKIRQKISDVVAHLEKKYTKQKIAEAKSIVSKRFPKDKNQVHLFISGKTYIFPWIHHWLKQQFKLDGNSNQLKTRLARYYDLRMDPGLKTTLEKACKGGRPSIF